MCSSTSVPRCPPWGNTPWTSGRIGGIFGAPKAETASAMDTTTRCMSQIISYLRSWSERKGKSNASQKSKVKSQPGADGVRHQTDLPPTAVGTEHTSRLETLLTFDL